RLRSTILQVMRSSPMRRSRSSRSASFTASSPPRAGLPVRSTALYSNVGMPSHVATSQVDGTRELCKGGHAVEHALNAGFGEWAESFRQGCGTQLLRSGSPRDELVHVTVHDEELHHRRTTFVTFVVAVPAAR